LSTLWFGRKVGPGNHGGLDPAVTKEDMLSAPEKEIVVRNKGWEQETKMV